MAVPDTPCQHYCSALQPPSDASGSVSCFIAKRRHDKSCLGDHRKDRMGSKEKSGSAAQVWEGCRRFFCHSFLWRDRLHLPAGRMTSAGSESALWGENSCREVIMLFLIKADFYCKIS